jgi:hypothetical protein
MAKNEAAPEFGGARSIKADTRGDTDLGPELKAPVGAKEIALVADAEGVALVVIQGPEEGAIVETSGMKAAAEEEDVPVGVGKRRVGISAKDLGLCGANSKQRKQETAQRQKCRTKVPHTISPDP